MSVSAMLGEADLHGRAAKLAGLDQALARQAMAALGPAIARQLKARAATDQDLMDDLLGLIEDQDSSAPPDAEALTSPEALADGNAILKDIYGTRQAGLKALAHLAPGLSAAALGKLAAISATEVVANLMTANRPMALTGAPTATGGGGLVETIVDALVRGVVSEAKRQISQRTGVRWGTRRRSSARRRKTTSKSRKRATRRSSSISLEDLFRSILK